MLKYILYVRFKGHSMLAPFTAGWQSTDLHPLVIERSEVLRSCILQVLGSLLQCSARFWKWIACSFLVTSQWLSVAPYILWLICRVLTFMISMGRSILMLLQDCGVQL